MKLKKRCVYCRHCIRLHWYTPLPSSISCNGYIYNICNKNKNFEREIENGEWMFGKGFGVLEKQYGISDIFEHYCKDFSQRHDKPTWPDKYQIYGKCKKLILEKRDTPDIFSYTDL